MLTRSRGTGDATQLTDRNDNDQDKNDDTGDQAHAHLHVLQSDLAILEQRHFGVGVVSHLPPHLLAHPVCAPAESLSRHGEVVCLVLERIQTLATLRYFVDVLAHHTDGIIDLLVCESQLCDLTLIKQQQVASRHRLDGEQVASAAGASEHPTWSQVLLFQSGRW